MRFIFQSEYENAQNEAASAEIPGLLPMLSKFTNKNTFNADGCILIYEVAPDSAIAKRLFPRRNKFKEMIIVFVYFKGNGTEEYTHMLIRNAQHPRPFQMNYRHEYSL